MKGVIDPGHGGKFRGAVAENGVAESAITLEFSKRLTNMMRAEGHDVLQTRDHDNHLHESIGVDLSRRAAIANGCGADYFISIHCNSYQDDRPRGFEIWTTPGDTAADPLATSIFESIEAVLPEYPLRKDLTDGDPDKESRFQVLMQTGMPAVLIELGFMSNSKDLALLCSRDWQIRAALAIGYGIRDWARSRS